MTQAGEKSNQDSSKVIAAFGFQREEKSDKNLTKTIMIKVRASDCREFWINSASVLIYRTKIGSSLNSGFPSYVGEPFFTVLSLFSVSMIFGKITRVSQVFRDGAFDIQGVVIFPCNKLFFFSFWTTSYLKKTATSFLFFFKITN